MKCVKPKTSLLKAILVLGALTATFPSRADNSDCNLIITTGLRNIDISSTSDYALDAMYSNYCDASGNSTSSSANVGVNVVIDSIPIGLTGGTKDAATAFHNFCKNYQATYQSHSTKFTYESKVVAKAYDAFNQCVALQANGISIRHNVISLATSSFYMSASNIHPLTIQGVTTSPNVVCTGQDPKGKKIAYDPTTNLTTITNVSFVCQRTGAALPAGSTYYDDGSISIATNAGPYDVLLPHDTKFGIDQASQLSAQIQDAKTELNTKITAANARISGITLTESATTTLPAFACGQQAIATTPLTYAMGSRDGTSCGVQNLVYVKTLGVNIPPP